MSPSQRLPLPPSQLPVPPGGNEYRGKLILAFTWWTVPIATLFVALRVITRRHILRGTLWWDDWFIIAAMTANLMGAILDSFEVHFGFGRHQHYISDNSLRYFTALTYGEWIQTFFTLMCTKISICFFLLRLQKLSMSKHLIRPIQAAIVILIVSNIVLTLIWILQCVPAWATWNLDINGKCLDHGVLVKTVLAQAIISIISDFALAFYPILILWNVQLRRWEKAGLCALMGLGVLTGSCCVVRTALNNDALAVDSTYGGVANWFWRLFEVELGIICSCIPTLIPLRKWLKTCRYGRRNVSDVTLADAIARNPTKILGRGERSSASEPENVLSSTSSPNEVNERALMGRVGSDLEKEVESQFGPASSSGNLSSWNGDRFDRPNPSSVGQKRKRDRHNALRAANAATPPPPSSEKPLHTFFSDNTADNLSHIPPSIPEAETVAPGPRKPVSFSRRDISHRPDPATVPQMTVTGPTPANSVRRPERAQIYAPLGVRPPAPVYGPPSPAVRVTGDPQHELDVNFGPRFDKNRGKWGRILDINRLSWVSGLSGSSGRIENAGSAARDEW